MPGFLLIDKPAGITSHDVVDRVRRLLSERRVGHAGTLDPFATGLLIVAVGREATREISKFVGLDKTYEATFVIGASTDTDDTEGVVTFIPPSKPITETRLLEALKQFEGEIDQIPPAYSAIKIGGKKMYEAAREGKPLEAKPRHVTINKIELLDGSKLNDPTTPRISVSISCSSGTYIRAIARDLGANLGTGGYVETLRRTSIGPFTIQEASPIAPDQLIPIETLLSKL